jgi:hypothetical protein
VLFELLHMADRERFVEIVRTAQHALRQAVHSPS